MAYILSNRRTLTSLAGSRGQDVQSPTRAFLGGSRGADYQSPRGGMGDTDAFYDSNGTLQCSGIMNDNMCSTTGRTKVTLKSTFAPATLAEAQKQAAEEAKAAAGSSSSSGVMDAVKSVGLSLLGQLFGSKPPPPVQTPLPQPGMSTTTKVAIAGGALVLVALVASRR